MRRCSCFANRTGWSRQTARSSRPSSSSRSLLRRRRRHRPRPTDRRGSRPLGPQRRCYRPDRRPDRLRHRSRRFRPCRSCRRRRNQRSRRQRRRPARETRLHPAVPRPPVPPSPASGMVVPAVPVVADEPPVPPDPPVPLLPAAPVPPFPPGSGLPGAVCMFDVHATARRHAATRPKQLAGDVGIVPICLLDGPAVCVKKVRRPPRSAVSPLAASGEAVAGSVEVLRGLE